MRQIKKRTLSRLRAGTASLLALLLTLLLCGCNGQDGGTKSHARIELPANAAISPENGDFLNRVSIGEGVGAFALTPCKYGQTLREFAVLVENQNDFPAGAYLTFVARDENGGVLAARSGETVVLVPGARDVLTPFDGTEPDGFASLEITAYAREKRPNEVRMCGNIPASRIHETGRALESGGMHDGKLRLELSVSDRNYDGGEVSVFFYDADGGLLSVQTTRLFVDSRKQGKANVRLICPNDSFADYEILMMDYRENVPTLPESVYAAYREMGCLTAFDTEDTSLDGRVAYTFTEAADGTILLRAENRSDAWLDWYIDHSVIYSGGRAAHTPYLSLAPGETISWKSGFQPGCEFWLMPTVTRETEAESCPTPLVTLAEENGKRMLRYDAEEALRELDDTTTLELAATVVFCQNGKAVSAEYVRFIALEEYREPTEEVALNYSDRYDDVEIYLRCRQVALAVWGY